MELGFISRGLYMGLYMRFIYGSFSPSKPKIAETLSMTFLVPNKAILNANSNTLQVCGYGGGVRGIFSRPAE